MLDHEKLDVYQLARQHARECSALIRQLPKGRADIIDQYRRATLSLPLNIAEGAGEFAPREKARLYRIARRSADECSALLDHLVDWDMATVEQLLPAKGLLRRIVGALVRLIHSTERIARPEPSLPAPAPARKRAPGPVP